MISKINKLVPVGMIFVFILSSIPMNSNGRVDTSDKSREISRELLEKLNINNDEKSRCGRRSLCRIYGENIKMNEQNSLKFIALVNTLSGKK